MTLQYIENNVEWSELSASSGLDLYNGGGGLVKIHEFIITSDILFRARVNIGSASNTLSFSGGTIDFEIGTQQQSGRRRLFFSSVDTTTFEGHKARIWAQTEHPLFAVPGDLLIRMYAGSSNSADTAIRGMITSFEVGTPNVNVETVGDVAPISRTNMQSDNASALSAISLDLTASADGSIKLINLCTENTDMVGTDNAALAGTALTDATWTDAKAAFLDSAISKISGDITTAHSTTDTLVSSASSNIQVAIAAIPSSAGVPSIR